MTMATCDYYITSCQNQSEAGGNQSEAEELKKSGTLKLPTHSQKILAKHLYINIVACFVLHES